MSSPYAFAVGLLALLLLGDPSATGWQVLVGGLLAMVVLFGLWRDDLRDTPGAG